MKKNCLGLLIGATFLLSGCLGGISPPSRFYMLSSDEDVNVAGQIKTSVGVLPVIVPESLDKPQIVLKETKDRMSVSETNRWIEPLSVLTQQALVRNLQNALPNAYVKTKEYNSAQFKSIIQVEINQMTGSFATKTALLSVWWSVWDINGNELYRNRYQAEQTFDGSYDAYVQTQSALWADVSEQIAGYLAKK